MIVCTNTICTLSFLILIIRPLFDSDHTTAGGCLPPDTRHGYVCREPTDGVKHLPKHLQPRWRYLVVTAETWPSVQLDRKPFQRALWYSAQNLLGDSGSAALDLSVFRFRSDTGVAEAVLRTHRGEVDRARAVVACVDRVDDDPVGLCVRGVSGTVRACEEKYMGRRRVNTEERDVAFEETEQPAVVRGDRVDVRVEHGFVGATALETE